ncbi:hypothetical protein TNCV_3347461 [Trichonephila clavipes]|nr:hypothetical protein TNCV_3347461 [Trichonephila clavipes]
MRFELKCDKGLMHIDRITLERRENNSTRPLNSKTKTIAGVKQLKSAARTKQRNSAGENNSTRQQERDNSTQQEKTTQLVRRNSPLHCRRPPAPPSQQNRFFLPLNTIQRKEF